MSIFKKFESLEEIAIEIAEIESIELGGDNVAMVKDSLGFSDDLEIVEHLAELNGSSYSSNEKVVSIFENLLKDCCIDYKGDTVAKKEDFSNWMDSLLTDGLMHSEQVNNYTL